MSLIKRSLTIAGHRTSIALEADFWEALHQAARNRTISIAALVAEIDSTRGVSNLSSAIRVWVLQQANRDRR
jgi:predicted DNA-binding ribbon-helix-helix protein